MPSRTMASPTIRQYRPADDPQVWALAGLPTRGSADLTAPLPLPSADAPPPDCPDLVNIGLSYVRSGGDFLVADSHGMIVGTAGLVPAEEGEADIVRLMVHPAVRRQGIGTALLEAVERRAPGLGIRTLHLDVGEDAKEAIAFYRAAGFRKRNRDRDRDRVDDDTDERFDVRFFSKSL